MTKYQYASENNYSTLTKSVNFYASKGFVCDGPVVVTVVSSINKIFTQRMKKQIDRMDNVEYMY